MNLWTRICSISSACFILMLTRTLLMLGSIKTFSFSFRAIVRGLRRTSGELAASISGTLCLSDVCDAKLERDRAAVSEERTHWRYGRSDWDCPSDQPYASQHGILCEPLWTWGKRRGCCSMLWAHACSEFDLYHGLACGFRRKPGTVGSFSLSSSSGPMLLTGRHSRC